MDLKGRAALVLGSAANDADERSLRYAHEFVRNLTLNCLDQGMNMVIGLSEARPHRSDIPTDFDWTVLEAAVEYFNSHSPRPTPCVHAVYPDRALPPSRTELWSEVGRRNLVSRHPVALTASANRRVREVQVTRADMLVCVSGGAGVEQSAELFMSMRKPVIPFDLDLGARNNDGFGGAAFLSEVVRRKRALFFEFEPGEQRDPLAAYENTLSIENTLPEAAARETVRFMRYLRTPNAFVVRLENPHVQGFAHVESFFEHVVSPVVQKLGYQETRIAVDKAERALISQDIFEKLHHAGIVIADLTSGRPNCYLELGYALGRRKPTLLTQMAGSDPPFDINQMQHFFWTSGFMTNLSEEIVRFEKYWKDTIEREPIVSRSEEDLLEQLGAFDRQRSATRQRHAKRKPKRA